MARTHEGKAKVLSEKEYTRAMTLALAMEKHGRRNAALIAISYYCGLRAKEMAGMLLSDVLTADRELKSEVTLRTATTKNGKKRMAYIVNAKLRQILSLYLEERRNDALGRPLFLSQKGGAFSPNSMQRLFSTLYQELAGIEGATSHSGRRTFATNVLNGGASIKDLQVLMGHSSINTTAIYVQEDPERLANLVKKLR
jgi:integrase/recombinase XerD